MQFNGFEVFPCGNATLSINNNVLTVSNIGNSGLDGVLINVDGNNEYTVNFGTLETISQNNGVLKCTSLIKNNYGQVSTDVESYKWYDADTNKIISGYNASLLPENYNIWGKLNGTEVFNIPNTNIPTSPDGDFPPPDKSPAFITWAAAGVLVGIATIGVIIWAELHTKETYTVTHHYDAEGNLTGIDRSLSEDPNPFDIEVNGTTYTVTEYGISYNTDLGPLIGYPSIDASPIGKQITGYNLSSFEITSITTP